MYTDVKKAKPNQFMGKFSELENKITQLEKKIIHLESIITSLRIPKSTTTVGNQSGVIKEVVYVKDYDFKDESWQQFFITMSNNERYRHDKRKGEFDKNPLLPGDNIVFELDKDKLRKVVKVHPIH